MIYCDVKSSYAKLLTHLLLFFFHGPNGQLNIYAFCCILALIVIHEVICHSEHFNYVFNPCLLTPCRYPYLAVVLNFSQSWALYCLVQFYSVTKDKLAPIKPLPKFLAFKSIVFLTWWQGIAVAFLFSMGAFKGALAQELKTRIQDYIICIEVCYKVFLSSICPFCAP